MMKEPFLQNDSQVSTANHYEASSSQLQPPHHRMRVVAAPPRGGKPGIDPRVMRFCAVRRKMENE
jgi:hypothetical protein